MRCREECRGAPEPARPRPWDPGRPSRRRPPAPSASPRSPAAAVQNWAGPDPPRPGHWAPPAKSPAAGATGYPVNLAVYTALPPDADWHYAAAATASFLVAVTN